MSALSDFELGWLVGILEGEGHFGLYTSHVVEVNMTDEDTICRIASMYERILGVSVDTMWIPRKRGQEVYSVRIYGERARTIMRLVVMHMSYRRRQKIWQCLNGYRSQRQNVVNILEVLNIGAKK
jgi:hypothetical protein